MVVTPTEAGHGVSVVPVQCVTPNPRSFVIGNLRVLMLP